MAENRSTAGHGTRSLGAETQPWTRRNASSRQTPLIQTNKPPSRPWRRINGQIPAAQERFVLDACPLAFKLFLGDGPAQEDAAAVSEEVDAPSAVERTLGDHARA